MPIKNEQGHWIDGKGDAVPPKYVKPYDKRRDRMVEKLFRRAKKVSAMIMGLKQLAFNDIELFLRNAEKQYGMTVRTAKGNKILTDFSNTLKIEIKVNTVIDFDERLQMAKAIIDECIKRWSEGSSDNIKLIVERAFQVDKKGHLDKDRILDLRSLAIKDPEWKKAMDLINESIRVVGKRTYIKFWERDAGGRWAAVPLDIAGC